MQDTQQPADNSYFLNYWNLLDSLPEEKFSQYVENLKQAKKNRQRANLKGFYKTVMICLKCRLEYGTDYDVKKDNGVCPECELVLFRKEKSLREDSI